MDWAISIAANHQIDPIAVKQRIDAVDWHDLAWLMHIPHGPA
jgi:hypothetical protein